MRTKRPCEPAAPPEHLSDRSQALWAAVVSRRQVSIGRLAYLQSALESLDRADQARLAVEQQGMVVETKTTGAVHLNPLCKLEREARQQFLRAWHDLNLHFDCRIDGRDFDI